MRYFVTLGDREHSLKLERAPQAGPGGARGPRVWAGPSPGGALPAAPGSDERELSVDLLCPAQHGRPAVVRVDGRVFRVRVEGSGSAQGPRLVHVNGQALRLGLESELERRARPVASTSRVSGTRIAAPMPGRVVKLNVKVGDLVAAGAALLSVEAMKMENELQSPAAGRVISVRVQVGATVEADQELIVLAAE